MKHKLILFGILLCGIGCGVCLSVFLPRNNFGLTGNFLPIELGRFLDTDYLFLKTGDMLQGRVISKDQSGLTFQIPKGSIFFRTDEIKRIESNVYTRYLKEAW